MFLSHLLGHSPSPISSKYNSKNILIRFEMTAKNGWLKRQHTSDQPTVTCPMDQHALPHPLPWHLPCAGQCYRAIPVYCTPFDTISQPVSITSEYSQERHCGALIVALGSHSRLLGLNNLIQCDGESHREGRINAPVNCVQTTRR